MPTAEGLRKVVAYKKELSFGTLASPVGAQAIRRVTSNFNLTKETYQSEEIRTDYQMVDFRHGVRSVEGNISGELSPGTYSDFIGSALGRDFAALTVSSIGSTTIAGTGPTYTITRSTGSFLGDGLRVGHVIRLAGFAIANNTKNLLVVTLTATVATVIVLNGSTLTGETVATGGSYVVPGKSTFVPSTGHTEDSYTVEEWYSDIEQSEVTVGNKINTLGMQLPATGLTTIDIAFMGQDLKQTGVTQYFTSPSAQNTNGIFAAVNGALVVQGQVVAIVTGLSININKNLSSEAVVGSNIKPEMYEGRTLVDGEFSTLFQNRTFSDYFKDETEVALVCALTTSTLGNADFMAITLPRIKLGSDTKDDGEKGIVASNSFQALKGSGVGNYEVTTIMVQDSQAL